MGAPFPKLAVIVPLDSEDFTKTEAAIPHATAGEQGYSTANGYSSGGEKGSPTGTIHPIAPAAQLPGVLLSVIVTSIPDPTPAWTFGSQVAQVTLKEILPMLASAANPMGSLKLTGLHRIATY
jgi:hypothetical protein